MHQLGRGQDTGFKVFGIGPNAHSGPLFPVALTCFARDEWLNHIATRKSQTGHLAFSITGGFKSFRQRIGDAHTHAMQTARKTVGTALALVELAARMQTREHQLNDRCFFFRMEPKWDTAAIVFNADRTIDMQCDFDFFTMARQRFVRCVVEHLLNHMQWVVGAGVHARALFDGL